MYQIGRDRFGVISIAGNQRVVAKNIEPARNPAAILDHTLERGFGKNGMDTASCTLDAVVYVLLALRTRQRLERGLHRYPLG